MKVLFHARGSKEHHHAIYLHLGGRAIWHTDSKIKKSFFSIDSSRRAVVILASLLYISLLPFSEDASPPVFLTVVFML